MNIKSKIGAGLAAASLIGSIVAPAAFADSATIAKNGFGSDNDITINNSSTTAVVQANLTVVSNTVVVGQNTGGNQASGNTGAGGNVSVQSGDAVSNVRINVGGGTNTADVDNCGCEDGEDTAVIRRNGAFSDNDIKIKNKHESLVFQGNATVVQNTVFSLQNTGFNKANFNTGANKKVSVKSGKATSRVRINVGGSTNNY